MAIKVVYCKDCGYIDCPNVNDANKVEATWTVCPTSIRVKWSMKYCERCGNTLPMCLNSNCNGTL